MRPLSFSLTPLALVMALFASPAAAAPEDFGVEAVEASLSTTQAGAHPDLTFTGEVKQDPASPPNPFGLHDGYAPTRNIRFELPPGLVGDPNVLGLPQQCTVEELVSFNQPGGGCPNGSQVGLAKVFLYEFDQTFTEPVYMMVPPGGDVAARVGLIAGVFPTFVDFRVRSEDGSYGLVADVTDASAAARLIRVENTTWGVPAAPIHDTQRCTPQEAFAGCVVSEPRHPGSRPLPFLTNPTRCGVPLSMTVSAASWPFPDKFDTKTAAFPPIKGCDELPPYAPDLSVEPTNRVPGVPTGLDLTIRAPGSDGVDVLEPSQTRDIRIDLPPGLSINSSAANGLEVCSVDQVRFGKREDAHCPDAAKLASAEFNIPIAERRLKGALYLREPEPGHLVRVWVVADDLGAHVKLPGEVELDLASGQLHSVVLDIPQFPLREAKLVFKSGFRAPLTNPSTCGDYFTHSQFTPWSGAPPVERNTKMTIDQGCAGVGGFAPKLAAGTTNPAAGKHSPFLFDLTREDREQNPAALDITLPKGLTATLRGIPRCEGAAAEIGNCPTASQIGDVKVAVGAGPTPLWVPQAGKRPTAIYLGGPYRGAPLSIVVVVPAQAGPFDLGDEVVRSAIYVDPTTAEATVKSDPFPQIIEGVPVAYRRIHADLTRAGFTLNPTGCKKKEIKAAVTSSQGAIAKLSAPFQAVNCTALGFKPKLSFRLLGGTRRGAHPALRAVLKTRAGDANIARVSTALPKSEFLDQAHIKTVCTRVQFAADDCPPGSIYGRARGTTPLLDKPLEGPVYLRSSSHPLPDLVIALHGEVDVDLVGRIDSIRGGIRATFESVPDAPVTGFTLTMQGGKKGLLINSRNLCKAPGFVDVDLDAQNGKSADQRPQLKSSCGK